MLDQDGAAVSRSIAAGDLSASDGIQNGKVSALYFEDHAVLYSGIPVPVDGTAFQVNDRIFFDDQAGVGRSCRDIL